MMNRTTTRGGHNITYCSMVPGCPHKWSASEMMCLWDNWSIQLFVLLGLIFQIVLAALGSRRKTSSGKTISLVIWASYLLTSYFATLALSKLTTVSLNKYEEECDTELKALLAPLILLQLGNPDSITAYSVEDNRLGVRRVLNLVITFSFVVWILKRNWKTSIPMILYFPIFVAGIIKYGETIWALFSVYDENTNMRKEDFDEEKKMFSALKNFHTPDLDIFLKAYYRFDCLKPHLVDWLKHPFFMPHRSKLIENYSPKDVFLTTDMELGFMYDVLYTKAPVLYTKPGIMLRMISYFSLWLTLGGFMGLFFDRHWRGPYVIYTFGLLIGVMLLETYQLLKLFYSDWVIIMNRNHPMVLKFLKFLVKRSLKKERWSNRIRQFNFLDFCLSEKQPWHFKILQPFGKAEKFKRYWLTKSVQIKEYVKELLLEDMEKFETERDHQPFTNRGQWTLRAREVLDKLKWSIEMTFDRSIFIWHIATHVCYLSCHENSNRKETSKLISDYMMFLLVQHPKILSSTTAEITYHHTYTKLKTFLDKFPEKDILKVLLGPDPVQESNSFEAVITKGWNVLEEARTLARELKSTKDTWQLISSVWVEMLCFSAYNCQLYQHAKLLRRGGEIITHVWLLLSHRTDKFNTNKYMDRDTERE
ncbi:uncharacterized protein LOC115679525 [Syzygium oleosum]|uniref:uncharacterized protein LOC115679525 n=1 Tax=Syzygium oleosum TaxID=219896 RepID=UPI0011D2AA2B|nr:uncharacterized protein LOC115679525 [Syzygium oleosum]XP_056166471.1 uncharacterized protein LOC115679525 [Syzygium oleosum]